MLTTNMGLAVSLALGGLGIFLIAVKTMSNSLKSMSGGITTKLLKNFSSNKWVALIFGIVFTTMIQSSDGAVALVIGLISAGFMDLRGAIPFILGANIGTATTSLLVWLGGSLEFTQYFMILAFIGAMGYLIIKEQKKLNISMLTFSIGAIFLGLKMLGIGMKSIAHTQAFHDIISGVSFNPWTAMLASTGLTGLMQSSSATVTIVQSVYDSGASAVAQSPMGIDSAIAMVIGANIGTTFTALITSIGSNKNSKRIAVLWLFTNLSMAIPFMCVIGYYGQWVGGMTSQHMLQLAIAHLIFNVVLVSIFIWLVTPLIKLANWVVKNKETSFTYETLLPQELLNESPELAFNAARKVTREMANMTNDAIKKTIDYMKTKDSKDYAGLKDILDMIEITRSNLYSYLVEIGSRDMRKSTSNKHMSLVLASRSIERIPILGRQVFNDLNKVFDKRTKRFNISKEEFDEVKTILVIINSMTKRIPPLITRYNSSKAKDIKDLANKLDVLHDEYVENFVKRKSRPVKNFDYILEMKTLQRMGQHAIKVVSYISKGRKEVEFTELPKKLANEIQTEL